MADKSRFIRPRKKEDCLPPGVYVATLRYVERKKSKKDNWMDEVGWAITDAEGKYHLIRDYFVEKRCFRKQEQLTAAWALEQGEVATLAFFSGRAIRVRLGLEHDEVYGWKEVIEEYLPNCP